MAIGKIMILSFSDAEEHIMERIMSTISNKNNIEYGDIISKSILSFRDLKIHLKEQEVYRAGKQILLSSQEFYTLQFLAEHPGWVYTKEEIYDTVYGENTIGDVDNIIYCLICSLRKKVEVDSRRPEYIQTVRGVGYKFVIPRE